MNRSGSMGRSAAKSDNEGGSSGRGSVTVDLPDSTTASAVDDKRFSVSATDTSVSGGEEGSVGSSTGGGSGSVRVPKKFITTWRHACDKTKDRTRDLFKRWRTLPESGADSSNLADEDDEFGEDGGGSDRQRPTSTGTNHGWSVHVWATWVKRYPSDEEDNLLFNESDIHDDTTTINARYLTCVQREKLEHLFSHLFDMDRDDLISVQDFDAFCERIKHFADWSENSPEFVTLQQVKDGFIQHFILGVKPVSEGGGGGGWNVTDTKEQIERSKPSLEVISLEEWLGHWGKLLHDARNVSDFPVWLQYFPKIIYQAINTSGSGVISRDELSAFYSAILGLTTTNVNQLLEEAYKAMTANGEYPLTYSVYRLCFANFLLGRYPNGPGQYIFGHIGKHVDTFPIDYSAMNTPPDELERYTPDKKSNRCSVIV